MTAASRSRWRNALAILSAAGALAMVAWLVPASIHIVKWPSSGPVRLALLLPTTRLVVFEAVAFVLALGLLVWDSMSDDIGRAAAPFSLLWLWTVPFLPWLPDRLPLLLVLAGPMRWVLVVVALLLAVLRTTKLQRKLAVLTTIGRGTVFVVSLVAYAGLGLYSASAIGVGGDEPHYLIITESLIRDHDLKIENNHRQRDYRSFWQGELRPDFFERGKDGEIYSVHAPGLPALILPAYALGGRMAVVAFIALLAALAGLAVFDLAEGMAGRSAAVLTWAATCLTVPFVPHAWLIFPEMPGALIVAWAALWTWRSSDRPWLVWAWRGAVLGALPWLHTKFVVFFGIFGAALAWRLLRRPRPLAAFVLPMAASGALWLYSFYAIYGVFDVEAPYGAYTSIYVLTRNIPHGLLGIFFDQKFGLLFYSPIYAAAVVGAWLALKRPDTRFTAGVLLTVVAMFVGSTARLYMFWGGSSAPARFLVPILPCLAPFVALTFAAAERPVTRALLGLALTVGLAAAGVGVIWPDRLMLFSDPHGRARILEAIQGASPLSLVIPTFTDPDWVSQVPQLAEWLLAALVAAGTVMALSRWNRASAWPAAGTVCAVFIGTGAVLSSAPDAAVRNATALRGDLEALVRFDGNQFRTLDYATLGRATPDDLRDLTTIAIEPQMPEAPGEGYTAGPFTMPPGAYDIHVWFAGAAAREGEVVVQSLPGTTLQRVAGPLANPTTFPVDLPVVIRRLVIRIPDRRVAAAVARIEIVPTNVVPAKARNTDPVRTFDAIPGRDHAYLIYTDEHAYPENGVFWSRGTARTHLLVAPAGASILRATLSTGPMSGTVTMSVGGASRSIVMNADELKGVSFNLPRNQRLVPLEVESSVMFRPSEVDHASTDMRGLGCQVRISLE